MKDKQAVLFLEKKNQKDFFESGPLALPAPGSNVLNVFVPRGGHPLFSKSGFLKD